MKRKKAETYEAGYSRENLLKKCAAGALGLVLFGTVTGCRNPSSLEGDVPYYDPDAAALVSDTDIMRGQQTDGTIADAAQQEGAVQ